MRVSIIDIDVPELARDPSRAADCEVSVLLDLDGERTWFQLTVEPRVLRTFDASLIVAGRSCRSGSASISAPCTRSARWSGAPCATTPSTCPTI